MNSPLPSILSEFDATDLTFLGETKTVYRGGAGPGVVLLHEVPGIHPGVVRLARTICDSGMSVWMPSLFGQPGKAMNPLYVGGTMMRACVAREFSVFAGARSSNITSWLLELVRYAHESCPGPGVGVVGMCLTGGFGLSLMVDPAVVAPVMCNPSLPFAITPGRKAQLGVDNATLERAKAQAQERGTCILGMRFSHDIAVPKERFERLKREFGENFLALEIDSGPGNRSGISRFAHSVLGAHYVETPNHPTADAEQKTMDFLRRRLFSDGRIVEAAS